MGMTGLGNAILSVVAIFFGFDHLAAAFIISGNIYIAADKVIKELKGGE